MSFSSAGRTAALRIAVFYFILSALWILVSDRVVALLPLSADTTGWVQTVKGWGFISVTAAIIFVLVVNAVSDITRQADRIRLLTDNLADVIFQYRVEPELAYLYVSPSVETLLGYTPQDYYDDPLFAYKVIHPDDHELLERVTGAQGDEVVPVVLRWVKKNGDIIWAEQRARSVLDEETGELIMEGVARNVGDQIQLRMALNERNEELNELNRTLEKKVDDMTAEARRRQSVMFEQARQASLSELLRAIAHHWRQPLNVIALTAQGLTDTIDGTKLDMQEVERAEALIMKTVTRMSDTIDRFRDFYVTDDTVRVFDLFALVREVAAVYAAICEDHGIRLFVEGEDVRTGVRTVFDAVSDNGGKASLVLPIRSCRVLVKQVLATFLTNARESVIAADSDGEIVIRAVRERDGASITVEDTGDGVQGEVRTRMFEPYYTTKSNATHTGLGLYIARQMAVEGLHGNIGHARINNRTHFTLTLSEMPETAEEEKENSGEKQPGNPAEG